MIVTGAVFTGVIVNSAITNVRRMNKKKFIQARRLNLEGDSNGARRIFATMTVSTLSMAGFELVKRICSEEAADPKIALTNIRMVARNTRSTVNGLTVTPEQKKVLRAVIAALEDAQIVDGELTIEPYLDYKWKLDNVVRAMLLVVQESIDIASVRGLRGTNL